MVVCNVDHNVQNEQGMDQKKTADENFGNPINFIVKMNYDRDIETDQGYI
tara:strand:- start:180 stop:329 length:150 start_codon:yes stop_codon:yes gene_type:complete